jgi:hypothetical protein
MEITPHIFTAKVMHKRLFPRTNSFTYGVYYLALPLSFLTGGLSLREILKCRGTNKFQDNADNFFQNLSYNKFGALSFYDKDHGSKDGKNLNKWARKILKRYALNDITHHIMLVSMPRVFGYVFNPVSFWLCFDKKRKLRAVLCEVNNTFGETHNYLCAHEKGDIIKHDDWIEAKKLFHVSPFLKREGHYKFRFSSQGNKLGIWIDFYDSKGKKQLLTSLTGHLKPLTGTSLRRAFWQHPLVTVKTVLLIHWQALKLVGKGIQYIKKPSQLRRKFTRSTYIKKM